MLKYSWLQNPDNVSYVSVDDFSENFSKETGISNLREKLEEMHQNPVAEGITITGTKRTALKLFIPNLLFDNETEMGDTVWVYLGDMYPAYCVYWPQNE